MSSKFDTDRQHFCKHYSNALFLISELFVYFTKFSNDKDAIEIINKCLLIASFLRNSNRSFVTRLFLSESSNWKRILRRLGLIHTK